MLVEAEVYLYLRKSPPLFIVTGNGSGEIDLRVCVNRGWVNFGGSRAW